MHSVPEFLLLAVVVTMTPGPATALVLRVAARDGRRAAMGTVVGNSIGIFLWACLSALGVSSLILASQVAYDVLRIAGACLLVYLGARSLLRRRAHAETDDQVTEPAQVRGRIGWRTGLITAAANPKLAVFFIALFPQFLQPGTTVLPAALLMAVVIVCCDLLWFGTLIWAVDRATSVLRPRVRRAMERVTGGVMVGLGVSLAVEAAR
ncbi:MAG TPA: LysE family translocator [Jatrophihabitantaceae bacterium]|nr:LysE family translocator [Jatrophihabitantaceae bacterium]